ncbi:hypothetical protein B0J11DRAFT_467994 [Dendryphion nanum]|uniref:Suppressor of anucleate metulae protein B n=1 Tax=Dendryphion nanum TaxID=256645 RepID=A0A9P9DE87_9PLEO|nr:hypothetical protein B0J11DRAFT_467994 [Dendryphion nanum]
MDRNMDSEVYSTSSHGYLYDNQALCTQLLETVTAIVPLKISPSKIPGAGAGLFTTKEIEEGEEIFQSQPLVNCVDREKHEIICDYCFTSKESKITLTGRFRTTTDSEITLMTCSGCKLCRYCSKTCQKQAWKSYHKHECGLLHQFSTSYDRTRVFIRLLSMQKHGKLTDLQWELLSALKTHSTRHLSSSNSQVLVGTCVNARVLTSTSLTITHIVDLYCRVLTNTVCIYPPERAGRGTSLDVVTSLINHSCDPNSFVFFEGNSLRVRSLRKLEAGEEITHCYADVTVDVFLRRRTLKDDYFFDCFCDRCEKESQHNEQLQGNNGQLENIQQQILKVINDSDSLTNVDNIEVEQRTIMAEVFPSGIWPENLGLLPQLRLHIGHILSIQGRLVDALRESIRGIVWIDYRRGRAWIHTLFDLLQILARILVLPRQDSSLQQDGFPNNDQLWDIYHGYLHVLTRSVNRTFGSETTYAKAVQTWYLEAKESATYTPGTRKFTRQFKTGQAKLLAWAGVNEERGIDLK